MAYARRFLLDTNLSPNAFPVGYVPDDAQQEGRGKYEFKLVFAAFTCVVICILGIIAATRFNWLRLRGALSRGSNNPSSGAAAAAAPQNGLNEKDLELTLPRMSYDSNRKSITTNSEICEEAEATEEALECAICLTEYVDGDVIRVIPQCGHKFHIQCIDKWLMSSHSSCPTCRQLLVLTKCQNCKSVSIWDDEEGDGDRSFRTSRDKPSHSGASRAHILFV